MTKPVDEMTLEEIQAERAAIAAERAKFYQEDLPKAGFSVPAELNPTNMLPTLDEDQDSDDDDEDKPAPWPHSTMEYGGRMFEVRKPNESALMAVSMTSIASLGARTQMRIFTQFLMHHLSPASFADVVEAMTDPDSGIGINGLITALTKLQD